MDKKIFDLDQQLEEENDKYQKAFVQGFRDYNIDRFDLQRLEAEEKNVVYRIQEITTGTNRSQTTWKKTPMMKCLCNCRP